MNKTQHESAPPSAALDQRRVLLTGATGFTGRVLARQLIESGARVRAIARASSDRAPLEGLPIEWITGDVFDPGTVRASIPGMEIIIHVAAAFRDAGITDDMYTRVHVESTRELAEAALREPNFQRFVHVSTVGVHGHIDDPPADETAPFAPGDIYQRTKAEAELWLHDFARKEQMPYTVIRPAAIYGPGDRRLLKFFAMAARGLYLNIGGGKHLYHLIHVEDLAAAIRRAAVEPRALGEAFIVGSPSAQRMDTMARVIANALGVRLRSLRLPAAPLFWAAGLCETVCRPLGFSPPLYRRRVAFFTKDRSFDTRKMREVLGYNPRIADQRGLAETARWYREQRWL